MIGLRDGRDVELHDDAREVRLLESLHSMRSAEGLTHNFYRYPASMSPYLAREAIEQFTKLGDVILDPFVGGGTTVVEALAAGRRAVGIDLNPIATFVTSVKTTPLSDRDARTIRDWVHCLDLETGVFNHDVDAELRTKNMPISTSRIFERALEAVGRLPFRRQQLFVRCALLRLGQWAIDCKSTFPDQRMMKDRLCAFVDEMICSLDELVTVARAKGTSKSKLSSKRQLLQRSAAGIDEDDRLRNLLGEARLVLTSPPYPGVHVLYHRWQVNGRRETPAPYWLIDEQDGHGAAYYTLGSRTPCGLNNYFETITKIFQSVRALMHPSALVVQLVSFSDVASQLPALLQAMETAGYEEDARVTVDRSSLWRVVPNRRRWYNHIDLCQEATRELLLFHRPCGE